MFFWDFEKVEVQRIPTGLPSLDLILWGWIPEWRILEIFGPASSWKCHAKWTKILMYDGTLKNVEDIASGDKVMGVDSQPRNVIHAVRGHWKMYKVTPCKWAGDAFAVNWEHVLSLQRIRDSSDSKKSVWGVVNLSVETYLKKSATFKRQHSLYRVGVEFQEAPLSIDPYFLGVWLWDGTSENTAVASMDKEIESFLQEYAASIWHRLTIHAQHRCPMYCIVKWRWGDNRHKDCLKVWLQDLGVISNKHIPKTYLINSRENRLKLLAGLIDTDWHVYWKHKQRIEIVQVNKSLTADILFLARSLWFYASMKKITTEIKKTWYKGVAYSLCITGDLRAIPTKIARKQNLGKTDKNVLCSNFSIEPVGYDNFYGFTLDWDKLYLLDSFIVNHNTSLAIKFLAEVQKKFPDKKVAFIDVEHALDPEYARTLGLNMDEVIFSQPSWWEEALGIMDMLIDSWEVKAIVLDSVAKLTPRKEVEGDIWDAEMAWRARLMSQGLRKITPKASKNMCTCFFINQVRMQVGQIYWNPETRPGWQALPFDASIVIRTSTKQVDEETGETTMKVIKNKVGRPFLSTKITIRYGQGFDFIQDLITCAIEKAIITRAGSFYSFDEKKWQWEEKMRLEIAEDKKLQDKIKAKIYQ